jgi:hypothetical protein
MAPTSRNPTDPPGPPSDRGPGGASVEYTERPGGARSASDRPGAGRTPPPTPGPEQHQQHPQNPKQQQQQQQQHVQYYLTAPLLVYDFGKKRRKRKKYSRGLKTVQRTEDGLTLAGRRFGDAVESGFRSYRKRRNKSARRKKDGPIRDIVRNSSGGLSQFLNVGSDIPYDVARKLNNRRFGKQLRNTVQSFTALFGLN